MTLPVAASRAANRKRGALARKGGPRDNGIQAAIVSLKRELPTSKWALMEETPNAPFARRPDVIRWEVVPVGCAGHEQGVAKRVGIARRSDNDDQIE
jgi:hypothetical protein